MSHEQFRQSPTLAEVLEAFLGKYHNPKTRKGMERDVGRACDVLGIDRHGVHGFRRAVGVRMIDAGESVEYVADVLNDSVQVATKHYSPRTIPAAKEAAKKLSYVPPHRRKVRRFDAG